MEEQNLAHQVVKQLIVGLENKRHVVVMDNYFTNVGFFYDLEHRGLYVTGTMRLNRIRVHLDMRKIKEFKRRTHGDLDWFIHESRQMSSVYGRIKCQCFYCPRIHLLYMQGTLKIALFLAGMVLQGPIFKRLQSFKNIQAT